MSNRSGLTLFAGAERVSAQELRTSETELPLDRLLGELLEHAKHVREVCVVDGTTPGQLSSALNGEMSGVVVHA